MAEHIVQSVAGIATEFTPETFGRLTTVGPVFFIPVGKQGKQVKCHMVRCVCGTQKRVRRDTMLAGTTKSCGCLNREIITKHGHHKGGKASPEADAYYCMIARCANPKHHAYADYGGRGIGVWPDWNCPGGFEVWLAHIGPKPHPKMTQNRIDNDGNYEPGNVEWATMKEQNNNKRNTVLLTHNGETKTQAQWAKDTGISQQTILWRLRAGWSVEKTLTHFPGTP